jgi:dTDP-4-amino-4,6-dideoxygalactose transaminase
VFGSFSLHPRKSITAGEGGILLTPDSELANKVRQLRNHGLDPEKAEMDFVNAGFNYRMTDFQAALALSQFQRLEKILQKKNKLAEIYFNEINNSHIKMPAVPEGHNHTWQTFHLLLDDSLDQKEAIKKLKGLNIGTNYGAQCIPAQTYYKGKYGYDSQKQFPEAYRAYKKGLAIPIYERLSEEDVVLISKIINEL